MEFIRFKIGDQVEMRNMALIGTVAGIEGKWITVNDGEGAFLGKFKFDELKEWSIENE